MSLDTETEERKRRAPNVEYQAFREARKIVTPFQDRIGPWQEQLALLRTKRMLRAEPEIRTQAAELWSLVIAALIDLEAAFADCRDEAVAKHSLVASLRAALERLRDGLEALQRSK